MTSPGQTPVVLLTGAPGVGKTAASRILAALSEPAVLGTEFEIEKPDDTVAAVVVEKPFLDPKNETPMQEVAAGAAESS